MERLHLNTPRPPSRAARWTPGTGAWHSCQQLCLSGEPTLCLEDKAQANQTAHRCTSLRAPPPSPLIPSKVTAKCDAAPERFPPQPHSANGEAPWLSEQNQQVEEISKGRHSSHPSIPSPRLSYSSLSQEPMPISTGTLLI